MSRFQTRFQRKLQDDLGMSFEAEQSFMGKRNFKGGGSSRTTQSTQLDPVQRDALRSVLNKSEQQFQQRQQFFPGQTVADEAPATQFGRNLATQGAGAAQGTIDQAMPSFQRALNADVAGDPRTAAMADAAAAPIEDQFREQTLPSISSAAVQQGAFGGSRQGIVEGIAGREAGRAIGETRARVFNDANRAGLNQQAAALGMLPNIAQTQVFPSQVVQDVGRQQTERQQQLIDANRERFEFEQFEPEARLDRFASRASGVNLGGTTTGVTKQSGGGGLFGK